MKIFVAIPVYDGKLPAETVRCLLNEQAVAFGSGDELHIEILPSCSHAAMGRNQLADSFLRSDADKLFFLDADVTFDPGSILKLCHKPTDVAGGAYRYKFETENYPVGWLDQKELWSDSLGLIEVMSLPGGFLSISRHALELLREKNPGRDYEHFGKTAHCFFEMGFKDGRLYGEDSYFCHEWRKCGGKVYLDPEIKLTHSDFSPTPYEGHIGNWLKSRSLDVNG